MKDKEKQIWQDVANVMCECEDKENFTQKYRTKCRGCNLLGVIRHIVFFLNNSDYRKLPEDSVVLTEGEYSDIITDEVQSIERDVVEFWANGNFDEVVKELYNLGYRKLDDHAIMVLRKAKGNENRIRKETAEKFMVLRGYVTKQFHKYHEARDKAESEYKKCKEETGKAILNNDWHRCDAIMFILEDIATEFDKLIKSLE